MPRGRRNHSGWADIIRFVSWRSLVAGIIAFPYLSYPIYISAVQEIDAVYSIFFNFSHRIVHVPTSFYTPSSWRHLCKVHKININKLFLFQSSKGVTSHNVKVSKLPLKKSIQILSQPLLAIKMSINAYFNISLGKTTIWLKYMIKIYT